MIETLLKFVGFSAIMMLVFNLFLAKEKSFTFNRWVLLILIPSALIVPFLHFPIYLQQENPIPMSYLPHAQTQPDTSTLSALSPQETSPWFWFLFIYLPVFFLLLFKKLKALFSLITWTKVATVRQIHGAFLIISEKVLSPFSFGRYIFISPSDYSEGTEETDIILKHEGIHIAQKHHIDLTVMEFIMVVCWFNPVIYLVKRAMVLNHEYQADQEVQQATHTITYKKLLLKLTIRNYPATWTSSISSSALKNRLIMINKPLKKKNRQLRAFSFSLFTALIIAGFSIEIKAQQIPSSSQKTDQGEWEQFFEVETQPAFKGGVAAFSRYVENELEYPLEARQNGIEGKVEIQFVVEKDGSLSNVSAINGIGAGCDDEAVRAVKNASAFNPGMQRGSPVRVQMVLPIHFSLTKEESDQDKLPSGRFTVGILDQRNGELDVDAKYADGIWLGTVRDPEGNELPGANIVVIDTSNGSVTDINGRFSIKTSPSESIVVSFVGYKSVRLEGKLVEEGNTEY